MDICIWIWVAFHISKLHVPNHDLSFEKKGGGIGGERFFSGIYFIGVMRKS